MNYSFKEYQLKKQKIDKTKLANRFADSFSNCKYSCLHYKDSKDRGDDLAKNELIGLASIKRFDALSKICDKGVYFLKDFVVQNNDELEYGNLINKICNKYSNQFDFLIVRQPVDNNNAINALTKKGFYYVCSESIYTLTNLTKRDDIHLGEKAKYIRKVNKADLPRLKKIASYNHNYKRYLFDNFFEENQIMQLYEEVIENSFKKPDHEIFIYEKDGVIMGFISYIINKDLSNSMGVNYASLDYITVDHKYQKEGLGILLSNYALLKLKEDHKSEIISVKTMANNYQAINLLSKINFSKTSEALILHYKN